MGILGKMKPKRKCSGTYGTHEVDGDEKQGIKLDCPDDPSGEFHFIEGDMDEAKRKAEDGVLSEKGRKATVRVID